MKTIICKLSEARGGLWCWTSPAGQIAILAMFLWLPATGAETVTIPAGAETRENPGALAVPFAAFGDVSSQQIYPPSLFPQISTPGQFLQLDGLAFRLSSLGIDSFSSTAAFDRVQVLLSTSNGPFTTSFEQNHGLNLLAVYDRPLTLMGNVPPGTTPSAFDLQISFDIPFLYDPSSGNLLVEIRKYGTQSLSGLAAADIPGGRFYSKTMFGVETYSGGLETQFSYQVVPEPRTSIILLAGAGALWLAKRRQT
jgi:hypothetical protein